MPTTRRIATSIVLAPAVTVALVLSIAAPPASARTFDFNANGSMVLQPLPPRFACALERAMHNQKIPCQGTGRAHRDIRASERLTSHQTAYEAVGKSHART